MGTREKEDKDDLFLIYRVGGMNDSDNDSIVIRIMIMIMIMIIT